MRRNLTASGQPRPALLMRNVGIAHAALFAAALVLGACASSPPRPTVAAPPPKPASAAVASPATATPAPGPRKHEQKKKDVKTASAENGLDALAPAEVGYYMDVLQGRLTQVADKSVGIRRQGDRIVLDLALPLDTESASAQFSPGVSEILSPLSKVLVEYRMTLVSVQARPADPGTELSSAKLAEQQALAVAHYLTAVGVASKRIMIAAGGANNVQAISASPENRTRVQLQLEPIVRTAVGEQ